MGEKEQVELENEAGGRRDIREQLGGKGQRRSQTVPPSPRPLSVKGGDLLSFADRVMPPCNNVGSQEINRKPDAPRVVGGKAVP